MRRIEYGDGGKGVPGVTGWPEPERNALRRGIREIAKKGGESRFKKTERGKFASIGAA